MTKPKKVPKAIVDVRGLPIEYQQMAFEKGLIPYVPALMPENDQ